MLLRGITVKGRRTGRAQRARFAGVTNCAGRWICHQVSLSSAVVIFMKNAYLEDTSGNARRCSGGNFETRNCWPA
jgi:hypothetical protein